MPLDEVRVLLLKRRTSWVTKDVVWQELVKRAHATPEPWITVTAGMMIPGLKHIGGKLGGRYPGDRNDLDSEILEGFLQALDIADESAPKIYSQLYWAAFRRGHEACNRERRLAMSRSELADTVADRRPAGGHPDLVLADAMLSGVVTPQQADLVSDVLLDHEDRRTAATRRGMSRHEVAPPSSTPRPGTSPTTCSTDLTDRRHDHTLHVHVVPWSAVDEDALAELPRLAVSGPGWPPVLDRPGCRWAAAVRQRFVVSLPHG